MPIIGSGAGITAAPILETGAVRAVGSSNPNPASSTAQTATPAGVVTGTGLDPGTVPVDQDRVATIRQAIETNSYPVVPTKIGDAMIAAGMLLRMAKT